MNKYTDWKYVPENLKTKSALKELRLKPTGEAKAIKISYNKRKNKEYLLFDINETISIGEKNPNRIMGSIKGRETFIKNRTCKICNLVGYDDKKPYKDNICPICTNKMEISNLVSSWFSDQYVILDTETTGLDSTAEIVEISVIDMKGNKLYCSLVKPSLSIPKNVIDIHGISNDMVENAPVFKDVWNDVRNIIEGKILLIYNEAFDTRMINQSLNIYNITGIEFDTICIMELFKDYINSSRWVSLSNALYHMDIKHDNFHNSLDDCFATLKLLNCIKNRGRHD